MKRLDPVQVAERLTATVGSVAKDYEEGKLRAGSDVHPVKRLDDDWDPEEGISNENMMRLVAERLEIQGILVYFDSEVVRENIIRANVPKG
ncbi:hypothetical protein SEA_EMIANNA_55 [Gordonia phage Emianna]|uniref:Uncharacterized protein n=4 Tax=Foxborovirus TaxID=2948710 RepID=A0A385UCH4_9CAUD|nr:hypothetical protein KNT99_gp55 [Gordonia phage NatB6]YP_010098312.1 hypothetical protein KNU10_gp56 [Gordonia phage Foxboro]YP_010098403.1 hypothetical protein KNU11_gp55 [Gordonia phage KidneyBean]YP_010098943.1 hypothetical protein KNU15_gp55 [Gordonia phage Emianna]AYD84169.1 hypothetical protein SEA_JIFALL16_54 [Gordonia phage Jifall16]AYD84327.1 hypothetical protein SEA_KURT_55 [Gordonia phage Kurt]QOP66716.1 hypothetical protein SEA_NOVUMREGINA_55 [Gordonia phage NovumRegina]QOR558